MEFSSILPLAGLKQKLPVPIFPFYSPSHKICCVTLSSLCQGLPEK